MINLSIVIPVYNEEAVIKETYQRLMNIIEPLKVAYELIFVDDGSTDKTYEILSHFAENNSSVKIVSLSRNFGHQAAITAGMDYSRGKAIITMDSDLQHPPELIPALLEKWNEGYEVVYTVREYGKDESFLRNLLQIFSIVL